MLLLLGLKLLMRLWLWSVRVSVCCWWKVVRIILRLLFWLIWIGLNLYFFVVLVDCLCGFVVRVVFMSIVLFLFVCIG